MHRKSAQGAHYSDRSRHAPHAHATRARARAHTRAHQTKTEEMARVKDPAIRRGYNITDAAIVAVANSCPNFASLNVG